MSKMLQLRCGGGIVPEEKGLSGDGNLSVADSTVGGTVGH